jgi:hypothetical protein
MATAAEKAAATAAAEEAESATLARIDAARAARDLVTAAATTAAAAAAAEATKIAAEAATAAIAKAAEQATAAAAAAAASRAAEPASNASVDALRAEFLGQISSLTHQLAVSQQLNAEGSDVTSCGPKIDYLDPREADIHIRILPGYTVLPPLGASYFEPQLYDLHGEATHDRLKASNSKNQLEEYKINHCAGFYLSVGLKALEEVFAEGISEEFEPIVRPILNTLKGSELWFRKRLAFIRAKEHAESKDSAFIEYLKSELYGEVNAGILGSPDVDNIVRRFQQQKQKQVFIQTAKQEGAKAISTPDKPSGGGGRGNFNKEGKGIVPKPLTSKGK